MARVPETDYLQRLDSLRDELDAMRKQIDLARNGGFDRRKGPDRRAHARLTPDRRMMAKASDRGR